MGDQPAQNRYGLVFSEPHSVNLADIDGDGLKDIVTGKTYWSHHKQSPLWDAGAVVYWFRLVRGKDGVDWVPYQADGEAGIGRQLDRPRYQRRRPARSGLRRHEGRARAAAPPRGGERASGGASCPAQRSSSVKSRLRSAAAKRRIRCATGRVAGAVEGESLNRDECLPPARPRRQKMANFRTGKWSGGEQLFWSGGQARASGWSWS